VVHGADYDARIRWPDSFDPRAHGALRVPYTTMMQTNYRIA
jgi:hypothetical protein